MQKNPLDGRNVFFAGYADATLNLTTTVALENLPDNEDFLMKYTVINTEDGENFIPLTAGPTDVRFEITE